MSDDRDAIHFPEAETMPSFAHCVHGHDVRARTIKVRGERKGKPELANYTEEEIREIGIELRTLALDLNEIKRAIENRRGDHDAPESDFET